MNRRKIEKKLQNESELMYSNVFNNVLNNLGIDQQVKPKLPWWKNMRIVTPISTVLATSLVIGIIVLTNKETTVLAETAHIDLTINKNNTAVSPSFSYSIDNNNIASYFIAKNDNAKIIAEGIENNKKEDGSNGLALTTEIIKEANNTGYIDDTSYANTIVIQISSLSTTHKENIRKSINKSIETYCKENYIYASIKYEEIDIDFDLSDQRYEKIHRIYELAHLLQSYSELDNSNQASFYADLSYWIEEFKDLDDTQLDTAIEKLSMINQALESDKAKEKFRNEINKIKRRYLNGIDDLCFFLELIKNEIESTKDYLLSAFDYDYEEAYGNIIYKDIPNTNESLFEDLEWIFKIGTLEEFDDYRDSYYYEFDDIYDPFEDFFDYDCDYDWEFDDEFEHHPPKHKWQKQTDNNRFDKDDKDILIMSIHDLLDLYDFIITDVFGDYYSNYQFSKYRILANLYYQVNEKDKHDEYYVDYSNEYNNRRDNHDHHNDDEWKNWKDSYDPSWWDFH